MTYKRTRDYDKEYKDFHSKPEQVKNRMGRNRANYAMKKAGKIKIIPVSVISEVLKEVLDWEGKEKILNKIIKANGK